MPVSIFFRHQKQSSVMGKFDFNILKNMNFLNRFNALNPSTKKSR